jgi:murein DD-endopeptidase MepM/ murein hydrolase activator NlpD
MQVAQYTAENLEQVQEAYIGLQELSEQERRVRAEERVNLQSALMRERLRGQELQEYQEQSYMESLEALQTYVEGLEEQLIQFEIYRQEILDLLSSSAHIPPVRNMLNDMYLAQMSLQDDLLNLHYFAEARRMRNELRSDEHLALLSGYQGEVPSFADEIMSHIALVELTLQTKAELYNKLEEGVRRVAPYIRNYPTRRPVVGQFSSPFGWRGSAMHRGVDISAPSGTAIRATGGGTVVFSGWSGAYGNKVIIDHGIGIRTLYAHNSSNLVSVGQRVNRGELIARVGSTGQSTGPHVHYEVIVNGTHVNPMGFFLE